MKKDTLYIIDLDRTLTDVDRVMEITKEVCGELGIDFKKILDDHQELAKNGTAYSPFVYISSHEGIDIDQFKSRFIELSGIDNLLFADSRDFLDTLKKKNIGYMILTYGTDKSWQILKLQAAKLANTPYVIVKNRHKGRFISGWVKENGSIVPGIEGLGTYNNGVFIDDRIAAFIDMPDNCQGYLLDRTGNTRPDAELPPNVRIIQSLSEVEV